jgi:hypothetical protein
MPYHSLLWFLFISLTLSRLRYSYWVKSQKSNKPNTPVFLQLGGPPVEKTGRIPGLGFRDNQTLAASTLLPETPAAARLQVNAASRPRLAGREAGKRVRKAWLVR